MQKPDLSCIPLTPGVYIYKDSAERVIYIGKAKILRKRLASYFRESDTLTPKTRALVTQATTIETISTVTEKEALLLEASLIKKHRPRYNIVLRDDKEYQVFRIDYSHHYPRLEITRNAQRSKKNSKMHLYGPFSSAFDAKNTWKAIHRIFPLRRCNNRAFNNRSKPCLYYHIHQCLAPCVFDVDRADYAAMLHQIDLLLSGRSRELLQQLRLKMEEASEKLNFELAASLRDQMKAAEKTVERQSVVLAELHDIDVMGIAETPKGLSLGLLHIRQGVLLGSRNFFWANLSIADAGELTLSFLLQFYTDGEIIPQRIVSPWLSANDDILGNDSQEQTAISIADMESLFAEQKGAAVRIAAPRNADEERLVTMASTNAREYAKNHTHADLSETLARHLGADAPIRRIEAVDISHTGGSETRAGLVVFENGKPQKEDWRTYAFAPEDNINGDDYAALAAWAKRRAKSGPPWPDLLLVDGGKGQLAAVCKILIEEKVPIKLNYHTISISNTLVVPVEDQDCLELESLALPETQTYECTNFIIAGIAKARDDEGHADRRAGNVSDRIFLPGRSNPLPLKAGSQELLFLQLIRDHVHDFSIGRHRKARTDAAMQSELTRIPGFGPALVAVLWGKFESINEMAAASEEQLRKIPGIGKEKAAALKKHLEILISK